MLYVPAARVLATVHCQEAHRGQLDHGGIPDVVETNHRADLPDEVVETSPRVRRDISNRGSSGTRVAIERVIPLQEKTRTKGGSVVSVVGSAVTRIERAAFAKCTWLIS